MVEGAGSPWERAGQEAGAPGLKPEHVKLTSGGNRPQGFPYGPGIWFRAEAQ